MKKIFTILLFFTAVQISAVSAYCGESDIPSYSYREEELTEAKTRIQLYEETAKQYENIPVSMFRVSEISPAVNTDFDYTDWAYNEWEDCRYIYLPATADRNRLTLTFSSDAELTLNDISVVSGKSTALLAQADEFEIKVGGTYCGKLKIMQSNLGCIYLHTSTGGLDALDNNGNLTETGSALMLDANGGTVYSGDIEKITSHGNSSWSYSKKKPYNFKLPKKADLYGMGKAKKWMLIANYLDHSMLRNYLTTEAGRLAGMEYTIDSTFVDLYADGSYRGTYQLCERIQIQKSRLDIRDLEEDTEKLNDKPLEEYPRIAVGANNVGDCKTNSYKYFDIPNDPADITGGYLLQFQQWNRYGYKAESGFVTSRGQVVQIDGPETASKEQVLYIRKFMQELEDAIYSDTGYNSLGKHYSDYMDVESFAAAYIGEEFAMNIDSGATSFYMWKDSDITGDGKLHFSPLWDYDLAYGTFAKSVRNSDGDYGWSLNTDNLFAAYFTINGYAPENTVESGLPTVGVNWLGKMYKKDEYKKIVAKVWFERFEGVLDTMLTGEKPLLMQKAESILPSAEMSNAKWHTYGGKQYCVFGDKSGKDFMESVEILRNFAEKRKIYLSGLWEQYYEKPLLPVYGDVDCDSFVTASDAAFVLQKAMTDTFELPIQSREDWFEYTDVDRDNNITASDAAFILQKALSDSFKMTAETK